MKLPICVICKFYDEPDMLPIWIKHYSRQVGLSNLYLIDHGTDDGSEKMAHGANIITLDRSPHDDEITVALVSKLTRELLDRYKYVLYADADEIIVADPAVYSSLTEYADLCQKPVVTTIGLEVQHVQEVHETINPNFPILRQRGYVWFNSALCKPTFTSGPVDWSPGFHCMSSATMFDDLYLFHLRYFDRRAGLRRLLRSRTQPWAHPDSGLHQRVSNDDWLSMSDGFGAWPRSEVYAEAASERVKSRLDAFVASRASRKGERYRVDLNLLGHELWKIPSRFRDIF